MADVTNGVDGVRAGRGPTKCERGFVDKDGAVHPRAFAEAVAVRFHFVETGAELNMPLDGFPPGVLRAAAAAGINTSVGNTFGSIKDAGEALEAAESRFEQLMRGTWSAEKHTGPRVGDLLKALVRHFTAAGRKVTEADEQKLMASLQDPAQAKAVESNPSVAVHLAAIRKERAEAREQEALLKAQTAGPGASLDGLLG